MFARVYALIIKELIAVWQDKRTRFVLIVPPLIQLFIFANAATLEVKNVSVGILNRDSGAQSFELINRFKGSTYFTKMYYLENIQQMRHDLDNQKAMMAIQIDEEFSRKLLEGSSAEVQLIVDGRKSNSAQIMLGYASRIIYDYNSDLLKDMNLPVSKSILISRNWFNENLTYTWFTVPGLVALLTMIEALIVTAMTIARERELGTFDQLLVSPLTSTDILLGKSIPGIVVGLGGGSLILLAARFAFQVPFTGSLILLYISMFFFVCSIIGVGIFLSSLCSTQQQALLATFIFISNAVILSGFATPIETMPVWLQNLTVINPLRFMLVIVRGIFLKDFPLKDILNNLYPIVIIAIVNLTFSSWFFRKKLD